MDTISAMQAILHYTLDELQQCTLEDIGTQLLIESITMLSEVDRLDALRASLIVYHLSLHTIVPHSVQLEASLAILHGKDSIITAGTGSGKMLCQLIPLLL